MIEDPLPDAFRDRDGVSAIFRTRADADLVIEHLVQEYGLDSSLISVEAADDENTVGVEVSGGDHASGGPGHPDRRDAPLHGAIHLTVQFKHEQLAHVAKLLKDYGATKVDAF